MTSQYSYHNSKLNFCISLSDTKANSLISKSGDEGTHVDTAEIAIDGIPKVLAEKSHHGADEVDESAALVKEFEVPVVDVDLIDLEVLGQVPHQVRHLVFLLVWGAAVTR